MCHCCAPELSVLGLQGKINVSEFTDKLAQQIQGAPARLQDALDKASKQLESNTSSAGGSGAPQAAEGKPAKEE